MDDRNFKNREGGEWGELSEEERNGVGETVFKNVLLLKNLKCTL